MESLLLRSSRQLRRASRNQSRTLQATQRKFTGPSICLSCRARGQSSVNPTAPPRRWSSQTAAAASSSSAPSSAGAEAAPNPSTAAPRTHYEFFPKTLPTGPPPSGPFAIDVRELRREFLQLQAVAHPDRHPQGLKLRAEAASARINEAYKTLQDPLRRAQYLLSLSGIDVTEDETAKVDDSELLMEVLDAREQIESALEEAEVQELRAVNDERVCESEKILDDAFSTDDLERAKEEAVKLRYWINIKESLDAWERGKSVVLNH